ncbi:MAG: hypothetical protein ACLPVY_05385 [Acidimicrobiia bacterium]
MSVSKGRLTRSSGVHIRRGVGTSPSDERTADQHLACRDRARRGFLLRGRILGIGAQQIEFVDDVRAVVADERIVFERSWAYYEMEDLVAARQRLTST